MAAFIRALLAAAAAGDLGIVDYTLSALFLPPVNRSTHEAVRRFATAYSAADRIVLARRAHHHDPVGLALANCRLPARSATTSRRCSR